MERLDNPEYVVDVRDGVGYLAVYVAPGPVRRFRVDLASLTVVERRPGEDDAPAGWSVVTLNERCHLPDED